MKATRMDCGVSDLWRERVPGSYTTGKVSGHPDSIVLFMVLPDGTVGSVKNEGAEPTWDIVEHEDGTHTVSPSIFSNPPNGWHGYLERGEFREC